MKPSSGDDVKLRTEEGEFGDFEMREVGVSNIQKSIHQSTQQSSQRTKEKLSKDMSQLHLPTWPAKLSLKNLLAQPPQKYSYMAVVYEVN